MSSVQTRLLVQVHPAAPRNKIASFTEGVWHIKVAAPASEGKANRELVDFLSEVLGVRKTAITIVSGHTARRKLLTIDGLSPEELTKRLSASSSSGGATTSSPPRRRQSRPG